MKPSRFSFLVVVAASVMIAPLTIAGSGVAGAAASSRHLHGDCSKASALCAEVANSDDVFGHYVGHDEPSVLFYSHKAGSGNHLRYQMTLPTDPSAAHPATPGKSYAFELYGTTWFGMALCDTQSYPEQLRTCPADSDRNIVDPSVSPKHVGQAYMELQFYPPGWIPWPTWAQAVGASACDPTRWCVAMNIFSLSLNPVTGKANNPGCLTRAGEEYWNFAFLTRSGRPQAPPNPIDSTLATFTPSARDLFMNSGDNLQVSLTDSPHGLRTTVKDTTTGDSGSMTASAANDFAQIRYDPNGTSCTAIPYDFHPMYSTSTPQTRVTWASHSYNVAADTEIGHFQFCNGPYKIPATEFGIDSLGNVTTCPGDDTEEQGVNREPNDGDDFFCFPGREALVVKISGCTYTNTGFDGQSYQPVWPDGRTALHPTPFGFTSPTTGVGYSDQYQRVAFEADLPAVENDTCNTATGAGCTRIPRTDDNAPAAFYPFYTTGSSRLGCVWRFGNDMPGEVRHFGRNAEYGKLLKSSYTTKGGGSASFYENYHKTLAGNPCQ